MGHSIAIAPRGKGRRKNGAKPELNLGSIRLIAVTDLQTAPENDHFYRPVQSCDPEIQALAASIRRHGVQEPIVVSIDRCVLSGHRRLLAALLAGLKKVPCRIHPINRQDDPDGFVVLLREFNRQRVKSFDEMLREEAVSIDPEGAHARLRHARDRASSDALRNVAEEMMDIPEERERAEISEAKWPFLNAILAVIAKERKFWPISKRKIHYGLLNDPPLIHASKPGSRYVNDQKSYHAMIELSTRAQLEKLISWDCISDDTRLVLNWKVCANPADFVRDEFRNLLVGYWRDLQRSQPNHIEIVGEKNTLLGIIRPVAAEFTIPLTLGRGYCSTQPRHKMDERFRKSGKSKMVVLFLSDHDPDGDCIAESFVRSMRDDFHVNVDALRVALTEDQVAHLDLPSGFVPATAKTGSKSYRRYVARYGSADVHELEAVPSAELQQMLRSAIESVMDMATYRREKSQEEKDAAHFEEIKARLNRVLPSIVGPADSEIAE